MDNILSSPMLPPCFDLSPQCNFKNPPPPDGAAPAPPHVCNTCGKPWSSWHKERIRKETKIKKTFFITIINISIVKPEQFCARKEKKKQDD